MKIVVGQNTIVKKITVGTPLRIGSAANGSLTGLDDVNGSVGLANGTILQYDSASNKFIHVTAANITGSGLNVDNTGSSLGSLAYDSTNAILAYIGPSQDSVRSLFNATYDSGALGTLSYSNGTVNLTGPTAAEIRGLFSAGNDLQYNQATGEFSITVPPGGGAIGDGGQNLSVSTSGDYGSLSYNQGSAILTHVGTNDSDIRGSISAGGDLVYDQTTGQISYTKRTDTDIRSLFSAGGDLTYNSTTGNFSITTGAHYADSDARAAISVNFIGDTAFDSSPYGGASYNASTGVLTINGTTDSNIRNSLTVQDSGGLGSLTYNTKQGRIVYTGPSVADVAGTLSANLDPLSMGFFNLDSNTGQFTFRLEDDSVRSLFSVTSDDEGGTSLTYDSSTGQFVYSGPSDLDLKGKISAVDAGGDGSFSYHESSGVFTYTGPSPAEVRAHFEAGLGIDYNETTGTFRLDSAANIVTGSIVTGNLTVTDSATINTATINQTLNVPIINSLNNTSDLLIFAGDDLNLTASDKIKLNATNIETTSKTIYFREDDSSLAVLDGSGIFIGGGSGAQSFVYGGATNQFNIGGTTGLNVPGSLTGSTIDSLNKRIDELPDSAQMKGILSAGPGLSYDNTNGIYRIISSGVTAGTYGNATNVSQLTVDSLGIVTGAVDVPISTVNNFTFDSTSGNLKITTATDSYNVGLTLDPFTTNNLVEGPNNLYYTRARFDSALDDSTSETRIRQYFRTDLASDSSRQQIRKYINVGASLSYDSATGKLTTNQALDSNSDVNFQNITQSGQLRGPAEFIIDPAAIGDNTGTVKILGNLQVEGVQTIINSTTVSVNDKNLVLGDSAADSSALHGAGITLGGTNIVDKPSFTYSHADKRFVFNRNIQADSFYGDVTGNITGDVVGNLTGNVTGQVSDISNHNTDSLAEGSTNLYFTNQRARNSLSVVDAGGDGSFAYDSAAGQFTYTGPSPTEARAHFQVNDTGGDGSLTYDSATGTFTYAGPSETEWYQHFKDNADSFGDLTFDSTYGSKGGFLLDNRHILNRDEVYADSFINNQEYFLMYSGTTGGRLVKVRGDTLASKIGGGGGGGAGGGLLSFVNL